jgi:plasmid stabilization system protein ParE
VKRTIRWAESANAGFHAVLDFTAERNERKAERLAHAVLERLEQLKTLPLTAPPWRLASDPSFRRLVIEQVVVVYRVPPDSGEIVILSVRHSRQRPVELTDVEARGD